jgi:uncharacterized membrane protein
MPETFKDYHITMLENESSPEKVSEDDIKKARTILKKAKEQELIVDEDEEDYQSFSFLDKK